MKFCYADESGHDDGLSTVFVMAGVIVDAQRMRPTKEDWDGLLKALSNAIGRPVPELKTNNFYRGDGIWKGLTGAQRTSVIDQVIAWLTARKHKLTFAAIDKRKLDALTTDGWGPVGNPADWNPWKLGAIHLMLGLQKMHQGHEKNKGNTLVIMDREVREEAWLAGMVFDPPAWTETFYDRQKKQEPLNQVIDVPYFADSRHVGLLQAADFCAFFLRQYAELAAGHRASKYTGELAKLENWIRQLMPICLPASARWPSRDICDCGKFFRTLAPDALLSPPK